MWIVMTPEIDYDPAVDDWRRAIAMKHQQESQPPSVEEALEANEQAKANRYSGGREYNLPLTYVGALEQWAACHPDYVLRQDASGEYIDHIPTGTIYREAAAKERRGDVIDMPSHYTQLPVEAIDITEHFNFTMGNAIKYIWRADHKGKPIEDLKKAVFYLQREIANRESGKYERRR